MIKKQKVYKTFPMKYLVVLAGEYLSQGKEVVITAKGRSMRPLLRDGVDRIILSQCEPANLRVGDVALYQRPDGSFVIHRIVGTSDGKYDMLGDFQTVIEKGIPAENIIAVASGFIRGDKEFSANSNPYKFYVKIWEKKSVARRGYIFFSRKLSSLKRKIKL